MPAAVSRTGWRSSKVVEVEGVVDGSGKSHFLVDEQQANLAALCKHVLR